MVWGWFLWIGLSIAVGAMAGNRGRNGFGWFLLALCISPLLSSVFLFAMTDLHEQKVIEAVVATSKKCPYCAELIKQEAKVCRYCGRDMPETYRATIDLHAEHDFRSDGRRTAGHLVPTAREPPSSAPRQSESSPVPAFGLLIVILAMIVGLYFWLRPPEVGTASTEGEAAPVTVIEKRSAAPEPVPMPKPAARPPPEKLKPPLKIN